MFVKNINQCKAFIANDGCTIREWIHPDKDKLDLPYSIAMATVKAGQRSYKHKLKQTEVYLITSGSGRMHINDQQQYVAAGDSIVIPADAIQWIENCGEDDLIFIALVNPPWTEQGDIRLE